ncbi:hypothetical protein DBA29_24320 [Xenophilus aerolatus]|nr:hypothetical protein [Xenophilus aerolatus]
MTSDFWTDRRFGGVLRAGDSRRYGVDIKSDRKTLIDAAIKLGVSGIASFAPIYRTSIKGRDCHSIKDYSQTLVLPLVAKHLHYKLRKERPTRDRIVVNAIESLTDALPMYVVRRDIKSFYETVPTDPLMDRLLSTTYLPGTVRRHIVSFFKTFSGSTGIPRGTPLSPVLAEFALNDFDKQVRRLPGVYRYFRYADDILIFSYIEPEALAKTIELLLPNGMKFNAEKSSEIALCAKKGSASTKSFEYLGYEYRMSDLGGGPHLRTVNLAISKKKIQKIKTRIVLTLKSFASNADFQLCRDRMKFISGNYSVQRKGANSIKSSKEVKSGIYYNYKLCGEYKEGRKGEYDCAELKHIDGFFQSLIKIHTPFGSKLTAAQRQELSKISFAKGFTHKFHHDFDAMRIVSIKSVWRNA